jgi:Ca2+-dependent lipid-binding protein
MGKGGKGKAMTWSAVVHVVLVQARSLMAMDAGESSDPYCKVALGKERCKTKSISCTIHPKWREAFDLYWYEEMDHEMEISVWDKDVGSKDDFMGR